MDPLTIVAASAGANVLGSWLTNESNENISQRQMDFQERMSSTAHQRETQDLEAAGLNRILSASNGGASSPGGAGIPSQNITEQAVSSALQAARTKAEVDNMKVTNDKLKEETKQVKQQIKNINANTAKTVNENEIIKTAIPGQRTEGKIDESWFGQGSRYLKRFINTINPFTHSARSVSK